MNTMGSSSGTRGDSYGTNAEREALLVDSNTFRRGRDEESIGNNASSSSSSSSYFLNRKALALGALAFVSVGALVAGGRSSSETKSFATLGAVANKDDLPHSFSELGKKKNLHAHRRRWVFLKRMPTRRLDY